MVEARWSTFGYAFLGALWLALALLEDGSLLFRALRTVAAVSFFLVAVYVHRTGRHPIRV